MKNLKVKNILKIGVLIFGIAIFFWNCEKDGSFVESSSQNELSQIFENTFNSDEFKKTLKYQYTVDWSNPKKEYSEQLNSIYYEFPIIFSNAFNPDVFSTQVKRRLYEKYKIVVTENQEGNYDFFIAKYFLDTEKSLNVDYETLDLNKNSGYEATIHLYDKNAEMVFAKQVSAENELKDFYKKSRSSKDDKLQQKWINVCETITTYHYLDWYRVVYNSYGIIISSTYLYTTFEGTSQRQECHQEWIPDPVRNTSAPCDYEIVDGRCPTKFDYIEPVIMCEEGLQDDGFGNCVENTKIGNEGLGIDENSIFINQLNLTYLQKDWLERLENINFKTDIGNYLSQFNLFSTELYDANFFAQQAVTEWMSNRNTGVDFNNEIIKDPSFIGTKADCVLKKLIASGNNLFKKTSEAFTQNKSKFKLKFIVQELREDGRIAETPLPNADGIIEIRFDPDYVNTESSIELANHIFHESLHAELHRIKLTNNNPPNSLPSDLYNWYINIWEIYEKKYTYPGTVASAAEHYYMIYNLINPISDGLREFDEFNYPQSNYKRLAWAGLEDYGKEAKYITNEELDALKVLYNKVISDSHKNPCD